MAKALSQQLAELSVRAKSAEDAAAATRQAAQEKVEGLRDQARAAALAATEKIDQEANSIKGKTGKDWNVLQAKIKADAKSLKAALAAQKHEIDAERAENKAERLEYEASFAIDYAIASIEQAKYAVLDAIVGRAEAEKTRL